MAVCSELLEISSSTWRSDASAAVCSGDASTDESGHGGQSVEKRGTGGGKRHARDVVGDAGPQPDGGDVGLSQSQLECSPDARRHVDLPLHDADLGHQFGRRRRCRGGQTHGPGVGRRRREGTQPDDHPDPELAAQADHRGDEGRPAEIGLGSDQKADVGPVEILAEPHLDDGPGQAFVDAAGDVHDGAAGPLVDEGLAVEGGHQLGRSRRQQGRDGTVGPQPGVDPTFEGDHQHRSLEDPVHVPFVEGHGRRPRITIPPKCVRAISANRTTLVANPSTLERSPAVAPPT